MPSQVDALLERAPHVVALQEVTRTSLPVLRSRLQDGGLQIVIDSFSLAPSDFEPRGPRRYGQLTASQYPLVAEAPRRFPIPWPERVLSGRVYAGATQIDIHNAHVPPGSTNGWIKIRVLEGIFAGLATPSTILRVLCGDFNTPQAETAAGDVITWAQRPQGTGWRVMKSLRGGAGADWHAAERQVLRGLAAYDLADVYRGVNGPTATDKSWILKRATGQVGRRFDHVFASAELHPTSCRYLHEFRTAGLSDHSALEVDFALMHGLPL